MLIYCRSHWVLAVIDLKSQTIYYLYLILQQPYEDIKNIVTIYYLYSLLQQSYQDMKDIVNM